MQHITPRKSLGQNFLVDRNIAEKIVHEFAPSNGDVVVEIGPGEGALTGLLADSGARLIAVELDPRAADIVRERYGTRIEVLEADVLTINLKEIAARYGVERLRVIGNIPYYITSPILFHLFDQHRSVSDAMLMMQREVADRLVAARRTKAYGILTVMTATYGSARRLFDVGARCFIPPPRVTSSIVRIRIDPIEGLETIESIYREVVRTAFNQRRKTLRNALGRLLPASEEARQRVFQQADVNPADRAEQLAPEDFLRLARLLPHAQQAERG